MSFYRKRFQEFQNDFIEDMTQLTQEKTEVHEESHLENEKRNDIIEIFILQRGSITKVREVVRESYVMKFYRELPIFGLTRFQNSFRIFP
jgi:hypothetical protein